METTGYCIPEFDTFNRDRLIPKTITLTDAPRWPKPEASQSDVADPKELRRRELMKRERELWRVRR
jgi:hypothetical protein